MTNTQSLENVVSLYRAAGRPVVEGGKFKGEVTYSSCTLLSELHNAPQNHGRFSELIIDKTEILPEEPIPSKWVSAEFTWILASNTNSKFYDNLDELIKFTGKGEIPSTYYIISNNYSSFETPTAEIQQITNICKLIKNLSIIADYHDEKNDSNSFNLIFTQHEGDTKSKTTAVKTRITRNSLRPVNTTLLDSLASEDESIDSHHQAKTYTFKSSIVEFCDHIPPENRFENLILEWDSFLKLYNNNLSTYLSGFSFHKAKKEVATAQMSVAEQLSKITSETTGKVLSIPISFAAVIAIVKLNSLIESVLAALGLLILSLITTASITNQKNQLSRLISSRTITFTAFQGKANSYPDELNKDISNASKALIANEKYLDKTLSWYQVACWLPTIFATAIIIYYFGPNQETYKELAISALEFFSAKIINN
ncbi:Magnesium transporter [Pseudomonas chlororaphis]|uniref:hypothetical protein n=1 Tax=Pseudomonas chlororaphis TaxID=587753 RepID=UPI0039E6F76F